MDISEGVSDGQHFPALYFFFKVYICPLFRCASISWMHVGESLINVFEILLNLGHIFRVCSEYVQSMFRVCSEYAQGMFRYVQIMISVCSGYVQSMFRVCSEYVQSMFRVCSEYVH